jgi:hypothetical protein
MEQNWWNNLTDEQKLLVVSAVYSESNLTIAEINDNVTVSDIKEMYKYRTVLN